VKGADDLFVCRLVIEEFNGLSGLFDMDLDAFFFEESNGGLRHLHHSHIPGADYEDLRALSDNPGEVFFLEVVALPPPPGRVDPVRIDYYIRGKDLLVDGHFAERIFVYMHLFSLLTIDIYQLALMFTCQQPIFSQGLLKDAELEILLRVFLYIGHQVLQLFYGIFQVLCQCLVPDERACGPFAFFDPLHYG